MAKTLAVAKYLNELFKNDYSTDMDEMRMHKLMYFSQRESLMYRKELLFSSEFHGWKFGPVLNEVRNEYRNNDLFEDVCQDKTQDDKKLVDAVYERYKSLDSWKLSTLSHGELSWKNSRQGLDPDQNGDVALRLSDMRLDAVKELVRRTCVTNQ